MAKREVDTNGLNPQEWHVLFEEMSPCIVKIETPWGHGTGFYCLMTEGGLTGVATAYHVVQHADYWHQPIRIIRGSESVFLDYEERVVWGDSGSDSSIILFSNAGGKFEFPEIITPLLPSRRRLKVGVQVAWIGYPAIGNLSSQECFFSGSISAYAGKSYFIDGVAINGVSGGPVVYQENNDEPFIIGTISSYMPNYANDQYPYPGLSVAENVPNLHKIAKRLKDLDEARKKQSPPTQPPPLPPPNSTD